MADQWFIVVETASGAQSQGPMSLEQIQQLASSGQVTPESLVWKEGMADWVPAGGVLPLASRVQAEPPAIPSAEWYVVSSTAQGPQRQGPMPLPQLQQLAANRQLAPETLVWKEGMTEWVPAGSVRELFGSNPFGASPPSYGPAYPRPGYTPPASNSGAVWTTLTVILFLVGAMLKMCIVVSNTK
jgi:hypothetical protein